MSGATDGPESHAAGTADGRATPVTHLNELQRIRVLLLSKPDYIQMDSATAAALCDLSDIALAIWRRPLLFRFVVLVVSLTGGLRRWTPLDPDQNGGEAG